MKKIFFVALWCILTSSQAMEIQIPTFKSTLSTSQIDFKSIINPEEKERIEIHFFWTTGRPFDLLKDEYGADRHVDIGGAKWAGKFNSYIVDFLNFVPKNVNVVFVCDQLTYESNAYIFNILCDKFGERFKPLFWEKLSQEIYTTLPCHELDLKQIYHNQPSEPFEVFDTRIRSKLPECESYLKLFFDQGFCGNPAIASDVYRLVGMPFSCSETGTSFDKTLWTYTDVDTFCHALENEKVDDYLRSIMGTQGGTFLHKKGNNDVIKLGFDSIETFRKHANRVMINLMYSYYKYCGKSEVHVMNYLRKIFTFFQNNDFKGYMDKYKQDIDEGAERKIIELTGPYFVDKFCFLNCLDFPSTKTLEWAPIIHIIYGAHYLSHAGFCGNYYMIDVLMEKYMPHLRRAVALKRFGAQHPFNVELLEWLRNNNPYLSEVYKLYLKTYKEKRSMNNEVLRDMFLEQEKQYASNKLATDDIPEFFKFRTALRSLGIEFPIVPEDETAESDILM